MRRYFVLLAISVSIAAACAPSVPSSRDIAVINLKDTTDGSGVGGGYVFKPQAVFWRASNLMLPNSTIAPDSCLDTAFVAPDTTLNHLINENLDAGSPVQVSTSTGVGTMIPDTVPNVIIIYKSLGYISHAPGTDVTYTVPGAAGGFAASAIVGKTPKKLLLGPIDPQPTDSMHLTWNTGVPGTSAVNIALIYKRPPSTTYNAQVLCSLYDDGDFWVPKKQALKWASGYPNQTVASLRWITTFEPLANNALMVAISEFDTTKTTFP